MAPSKIFLDSVRCAPQAELGVHDVAQQRVLDSAVEPLRLGRPRTRCEQEVFFSHMFLYSWKAKL